MQQRGQTTTFQTRLEISEHAIAGLNDPQIASLVGCSVWTVRKWRRRFVHQGRVSLSSQMGRPAAGPVSSFPNALKNAILHLRKLHPGWGPDTLLTALKMDVCWADQPLPSRAEIARLLKHSGLTRRSQPHHDLIQPPRASLTDPHQEWQMDAQGIMRVEGVGKVSLISIVDVMSRLKTESYPSLAHDQSCFARLPIGLTPSVPHLWSAGDPHPGSWHCLLRSHHAFAFSHAAALMVARPWRPSALYAQALSHRSRAYRAHSSDDHGSGIAGTNVSFSLGLMGWSG